MRIKAPIKRINKGVIYVKTVSTGKLIIAAANANYVNAEVIFIFVLESTIHSKLNLILIDQTPYISTIA